LHNRRFHVQRTRRASYDRRVVRASAVIGLAIIVAARSAGADAPRPVAIASDAGTCPSSTDVTAALNAIFPNLQTAAPDDATALHVALTAAEHGIHVRAGDAERDFTGDDCAERARKAAVFVALVLAPPTVDEPVAEPSEPSAPASVTRAAVVEPPRTHRDSPWLQLDAGAAIEAAPRDANNLVTGGGQLGVFVGAEHVGAIATLSGLAPSDMQIASTRASLLRTPAAFGVRARMRDGRIALAADAALTTSLLVVRGLDAMVGAQSARLELGARVAGRVEFWAWPRIAVFAAVQLDVIPDTYDLALPSGTVGSTPGWWLGGVIGATAGFP
ncbi:MAG TPA: hypothetical protein VGG28_30720, partial [Kofleriaceae bacterium]